MGESERLENIAHVAHIDQPVVCYAPVRKNGREIRERRQILFSGRTLRICRHKGGDENVG